MLVRYSIVELLMVFEVSAQREHTIVEMPYALPEITGWKSEIKHEDLVLLRILL